jgi:hypothetical protein
MAATSAHTTPGHDHARARTRGEPARGQPLGQTHSVRQQPPRDHTPERHHARPVRDDGPPPATTK